jgi:hypothetical protein
MTIHPLFEAHRATPDTLARRFHVVQSRIPVAA